MLTRYLQPLALIVLIVLLCACDGPKQTIALNLMPGDTRLIKLSTNNDIDMTLGNNNLQSNVQLDAKLVVTVGSPKPDGGYELSAVIKEYKLSESATANGAHFPMFENGRRESVTQMMGKAVEGASFDASVSSDGTVNVLTGEDKVKQLIEAKVNFGNFKFSKLAAIGYPVGNIEKEFMELFNNEWLASLLEPAFAAIPAVPVGNGDTWQAIPMRTADSETTINMTLTAGDVVAQALSVAVQGEVKGSPNMDGLKQSGMVKGTMELDINTGLTQRLTLSSSVTGEGGRSITATKTIGSTTYEILKY